jgi:tRNA A37 threonylcarbamoyladenosine biosynthesis protein TsaE
MLHHMDAYRLNAASAEAVLIELEDTLTHHRQQESPAWVFIEWASLFPDEMPSLDGAFHLDAPEDPCSVNGHRCYTLQAYTPTGHRWCEALARAFGVAFQQEATP